MARKARQVGVGAARGRGSDGEARLLQRAVVAYQAFHVAHRRLSTGRHVGARGASFLSQPAGTVGTMRRVAVPILVVAVVGTADWLAQRSRRT